MTRVFKLAALAWLMMAGACFAAPLDFPQRVLYAGNRDTPRQRAFVELLEKRFSQVDVANRETFDPAQARDADVVLLDWSQQDKRSADYKSPLGEREAWSKPTVLLGSAGLLLAGVWQIAGGSG